MPETLPQTNCFPSLTCEGGSSVCCKTVGGFKKITVNRKKHKAL